MSLNPKPWIMEPKFHITVQCSVNNTVDTFYLYYNLIWHYKHVHTSRIILCIKLWFLQIWSKSLISIVLSYRHNSRIFILSQSHYYPDQVASFIPGIPVNICHLEVFRTSWATDLTNRFLLVHSFSLVLARTTSKVI